MCKVQCEMFSGHWPESLATGIQDLLAAANLVQTPVGDMGDGEKS